MPPTGRVKKVGWRREDAAFDAMKQFGFPTDLVKRKLKELLNAYGDDGWIFIEEASYKVLIEAILEDQNEDQGESPAKLIAYGGEAESSASAAALADMPLNADGPVESLVNQVSEQSTDVGLNKDNGEEAGTSNKETLVGDHAQFAGGEQRIAGTVVLDVATSSNTGQANSVMKNVSPKAAGTSGVDKPNKAQTNCNGNVSLASHNVAGHVETDVKSSEFQRVQSNAQPVKRRRKSYYGWYDGSEDRDVIDVSKFLSYKPPPTSELSVGTKNAKERKSRWDLKPEIL